MQYSAGTPLLGRFEVLTENISNKVTNALAFLALPSVAKKKKSFMKVTRGDNKTMFKRFEKDLSISIRFTKC